MTTKKITELGAASTPDGTELVPIVQGGATVKATVTQVRGSGGAVAVKEEGVSTVAAATALNFVGASVTVTDGGSNTAVITITDATLTTEQVQDIVGGLLADSGVIDVTYDDAGNTLTLTILAGSITPAMLGFSPLATAYAFGG